MMPFLAIVLSLAPWTGPLPPAASREAAAYRLRVSGAPNEVVRLTTRGVPDGWIASFCTGRLCAPFRYTFALDARGRATLEFQAVRLEASAPHRIRVALLADGAARAAVTVRR